MTTSAERRAMRPDLLPWIAALTGPPERLSDGTLLLSGWVVGPDQVPGVSVNGRPASVRVQPSAVAVPGLPADWPVRTWEARAEAVAEGASELVMTSPDGKPFLRRAGLSADGAGITSAYGEVDTPKQDSVVPGDLVLVTGWLLLDGELPGRVEVEVDGAPPVRARIMLPRADVASQVPGYAAAGLSGYEARIPVSIAPGESRRVTVVVRASSTTGAEWTAPPRTCTVRARAASVAEKRAAQRTIDFGAKLLSTVEVKRDPRHILVFGHSLRVGGGELWLSELLTRLVCEHGLRITLVTPDDGPLRSELEALGVEIWVTGHHGVQNAGTYHSYVTELAMIARASGAGAVMVNTLGVFAGVDAALRAELPVAWVVHESFSLADFSYLNWGFEGLSPLVRERWELSLNQASALLFVANATREMFLPYSKPRRCLTVRYGINLKAIENGSAEPTKERLRADLGIPQDAQVLLTVGVCEPRKGHAPLVVAFEQLIAVSPDAYLVVVGLNENEYSKALRAWVEQRGLSDRVRLVPLVRDPTPWLRVADMFVNSSDIESFPRSILEAIAYGLPVIAADVFGTREMITDGHSGWLFAPNDLNALTVGLLRAFGTPADERKAMAGRARKHVEPYLDARHYGEEFATILGRLADPDGEHGGQHK